MEAAVDTNILYGFIGFICLMLLALVGFGYRQSRAIGEIRGDIRRLETQIDGTNARIDDLRTDLGRRIDETNARVDEARSELGHRIDETRDHLGRRIDETNARIDEVRTDLGRRIDENNARIDEVRTDLGRRIDENNARIDDLRTDLGRRIDETNGRIDETRDHLERRIENQETSIRALHREVGEVKGMQYSLYDRLDLVMRHRHHDITGAVILTPEEMAAD